MFIAVGEFHCFEIDVSSNEPQQWAIIAYFTCLVVYITLYYWQDKCLT